MIVTKPTTRSEDNWLQTELAIFPTESLVSLWISRVEPEETSSFKEDTWECRATLKHGRKLEFPILSEHKTKDEATRYLDSLAGKLGLNVFTLLPE